MIGNIITKNSLLLGAFAAITTAGIAATSMMTKERIIEQKRIAEERALLEIIPKSLHSNNMLDDTLNVNDSALLHLSEAKKIYLAKQDEQVIGAIIPAVSPNGYSGNIDMLIGINKHGEVLGVRIISHTETPGLGDKIELKKSNWVLSFNGKSLTNPAPSQWKVTKDKGIFDTFTGATITPRAVVASVKNTLEFFDANKANILRQQPLATNAAETTESAE